MIKGIVTLNSKPIKKTIDGNIPIALINGSLVIHYDGTHKVKGVYMVTSFRLHHKDDDTCTTTAHHCSLINLSTGYLAFDERCSRKTTMVRVMSHLVRDGIGSGERAIENGEYIEVYCRDNYKINLEYDESLNEGWKNE